MKAKKIAKIAIFLQFCLAAFAFCMGTQARAAAVGSSADLHLQASAAARAGDYKRAAEIESEALRQDPNNVTYLSAMSIYHWNGDGLEACKAEARRAVELAPDNVVLRTNLASIFQQLQDFLDAKREYEKAIAADPQAWQPRLGMAQCLAVFGFRPAALKQLGTIAACNPKSLEMWLMTADTALRLDDCEHAKQAIEGALAIDPQSTEARLMMLQQALCAHDADLARKLAREMLDQRPRDRKIYIDAANILCPPNMPEEARRVLACASEAMRSDHELFFELNKLFLGKCDQLKPADSPLKKEWLVIARQAIDRAISLNGQVADYHLASAAVFDAEGDFTSELRELEAAQRIEPTYKLASFLSRELLSDTNDLAAAAKRWVSARIADGERSAERPYAVSARCYHFRPVKLTCRCHLAVMETKLRHMQPVIFAAVPRARDAIATVIYGPESMTASSIIPAILAKGDELEAVDDGAVGSIYRLVRIAQAAEEPYAVPLASQLKPPPLRIATQLH